MAPKKALQGALLWVGLLALPQVALAASDVASGQGGLTARASIDFRITVPRVMQMKLVAHPAAIDITTEDIARGSVKVSGAALDLLVNDRNGYAIRAELAQGVFNSVKISGLASAVVASTSGALIHMASMVGKPKPAPMPVEYELQLAPDTQPGHYAWPVTLSLQQL